MNQLSRLADVLLSSVALVGLAPCMLVIAVAVKLTSRGPVLTREGRVDLVTGRTIRLLGFRRRRADGVTTPVGRFLGHTSLNELPQLLSVLVGDMTMVQQSRRLTGAGVDKRTREQAARFLEVVSALVPKRLSDEEIGDALEALARMESQRRPRWLCWLKVLSTAFWVMVNAAREVRRLKAPEK